MPITCADIPHLPGLESIRFRAGFQGANRVVRWPYVAENDTIRPWVEGGELVFITGINHQRDSANLCQLIEEGRSRQVAGMVILTGQPYIRRIPEAVIRLANQYGFALLEQPYDLKMVSVTEIISNAIVQDNLLGHSRRLFLGRIIAGIAEAPELIHLRARELNIEPEQPLTGVVIRLTQGGDRQQCENWQTHLDSYLAERLSLRGNPFPVLRQLDDWQLIWSAAPDNEDIAQLLSPLRQTRPDLPLTVGIGGECKGLSRLADSIQQAREAATFAEIHQQLFEPVYYRELGVARLFAAVQDKRLLRDFCSQTLGPLCFNRSREAQDLKATLASYLNSHGRHVEAARALGIHRNTLRYRLATLEKMTGRALLDPLHRLNLHNALLIERILLHTHQLDPHESDG
ncbi:PucR family transcriptional regulator ligand-binding domain-containing protein [Brenneria goodwinii]|uniref:PucR family transcriptional regulator n=1 Tax=Brenneria goodwinii TaxID=1109412 RepID=UPI0036F0303B